MSRTKISNCSVLPAPAISLSLFQPKVLNHRVQLSLSNHKSIGLTRRGCRGVRTCFAMSPQESTRAPSQCAMMRNSRRFVLGSFGYKAESRSQSKLSKGSRSAGPSGSRLSTSPKCMPLATLADFL